MSGLGSSGTVYGRAADVVDSGFVLGLHIWSQGRIGVSRDICGVFLLVGRWKHFPPWQSGGVS